MSSAYVSWATVSGTGRPALANAAGDVFTSDGSTLTEFQGSAYGASVPSTGTVMAVDDGHAYTDEVAKYATLGGLHLEWSHDNFPGVSGVAAAPDGSVYVTGTFYGSFDADPGTGTHTIMAAASGPDAYLVKLDPAGNYVWGRDVASSYAGGPVVDITVGPRIGADADADADAAGDGYLAVTYANGFRPPFDIGGVHLMKFDPSGNVLWDELVGTGNAGETKVTALAVGPAGELAIAGTTDTANLGNLHPHPADTGSGDLSGPPDTYGSFVARYDSTGALTWAHAPKPNSAFSSSLVADDVDISPRGDVVVAVGANDGVASFSLVQRYDSNGTLLEQQAYDASIRSLSLHSYTGIVLSGTFTGTVDFSPGDTTHTLTSPDGATAGYLVDITDPGGTPARLLGAPIGTPGSWNDSGNTFAKALDNNSATFFDAPTSQAWVGEDFGRATNVSYATYVPRDGYEFRMVGGQFQGSDDGSQWTTVATITDAPHPGVANPLYFDTPVTYRYMRYLSPDSGFGNVAELAFYGAGPEAGPPDLPIHPVAAWDGSHVTLNWTDLATNETGYEAQLLGNAGTVAGADRPDNAYRLYFDDFTTPGTYYVRLRAVNSYGPSDWVNAGTVTIPASPVSSPLVGTPIGTPGSWNNSGNGFTKALDNDPSTYFDAPSADNNFVGYDFGTPVTVSSVTYSPRTGYEFRMVGGQIRASNDGLTWTTLATITSTPAATNTLTLPTSSTYRYFEYLSPDNGFGNVAELHFFGTGSPVVTPLAPSNITGSAQTTSSLQYSWTDNSNNETGFEWQLSTSPDFSNASGATNGPNYTTAILSSLPPGTYYFRVRALGSSGDSAWVLADNPVTLGSSSTQLTGTPIGTAGSWDDSGNDLTKAFDGDPATYFDAPVAQAWAGLDLGTSQQLTEVRFVPRAGFAWRMTGGVFQGSNDDATWTTLATINAEPTAGSNSLPLSGAYRYVRYLSGNEGFGNVAELQFFGTAVSTPPTTPAQISGTPFGTPGSWDNFGNTYLKALDGDRTTYFDAPVPQAYVGYDFNASVTLTSVTYYPRVGQESRMVGGQFRASNDAVHWTTLATITSVPSNTVANTLDISGPDTYRYVEYLSPDGGFGNVAELQFFGMVPAVP